VSHRGKDVGQEVADEYNGRFDVNMHGEDFGSNEAILNFLQDSDVVVGSAKAGIQVMSKKQLEQAPHLLVAADVNAVPPAGIEGIDVNDMGKELDFTPNEAAAIGALAIGNVKHKVHYRLFEVMKNTDKPLYIDHEMAFETARKYAGK